MRKIRQSGSGGGAVLSRPYLILAIHRRLQFSEMRQRSFNLANSAWRRLRLPVGVGRTIIQQMRLSPKERRLIRNCVAASDPAAEVMLFGSRLHDELRGGDIDLLVRSRKIGFMGRLRLKLALMNALGAQKIDIAVDRGRPSAFVKLIRKEARPI
jgi:uncharacterized protein